MLFKSHQFFGENEISACVGLLLIFKHKTISTGGVYICFQQLFLIASHRLIRWSFVVYAYLQKKTTIDCHFRIALTLWYRISDWVHCYVSCTGVSEICETHFNDNELNYLMLASRSEISSNWSQSIIHRYANWTEAKMWTA